jgi:uncharacterized membrane protein YqgA involved in biofilm formation
MVLWGTIVNALAIVGGSLLGLVLPRMNDQLKRTVLQGVGIALIVLGLTMAVKTNHYIWLVVSLVLGGVLGEVLQLERRLDEAGQWLERRIPARGENSVGKAFVTATLVYCVGAMAILGSIDSGVSHNHDVLYTKALLDGFISIIFVSTLGIGVIFSAIAVLLYQGTIALTATVIASMFSTAAIQAITVEVSAVGGILIIGIGINLLEIKKIHVGNLLPSVVVMGLIMGILQWI